MEPNNCLYCGNPLPEQATFCPVCGRPLYANSQSQPPMQQQYQQQYLPQGQPQPQPQPQYPQYPQQGQYPQGQYPPQGQNQPPTDPGNKGGNNKMWIIALLAGLLIAAAAAGGWWYWKNSQQEAAVSEPTDSITSTIDSTEIAVDSTAIEPSMAAPQIGTDMSGFHSVEDSPTTYEGLDVQLKKSDGMVKTANIYRDGELIQTLNLVHKGDGINYYDGADLVHFLDANFDGYVDMVIGIGAARNYSGIFLWNPESKQFVRATDNDDPMINADLIFAPKEKVVYASYSEGGGMSQTARQEWDGKNMKVVEWFLQMESWRYHEFSELNITHHYNVVNRNKNRMIFSTDDPKAVPARWKAWVYNEYANEGGIDEDGREPGEE